MYIDTYTLLNERSGPGWLSTRFYYYELNRSLFRSLFQTQKYDAWNSLMRHLEFSVSTIASRLSTRKFLDGQDVGAEFVKPVDGFCLLASHLNGLGFSAGVDSGGASLGLTFPEEICTGPERWPYCDDLVFTIKRMEFDLKKETQRIKESRDKPGPEYVSKRIYR